MISRREWWIGIVVVGLALLLHAALPRYEWGTAPPGFTRIRVDRWTGRAEIGTYGSDGMWRRVGTQQGQFSASDLEPK